MKNRLCLSLLLLLTVSWSVLGQPRVIIKKLNQSVCYQLGGTLEVFGSGFGANARKRSLVIQAENGSRLSLRVQRWSDEVIIASLPKSIKSSSTQAYTVGILVDNRWVSNRDKTISFCRAPIAAASAFQLAPKEEDSERGFSANTRSVTPENNDERNPSVTPDNNSQPLVSTGSIPGSLQTLGVPPIVEMPAQANKQERRERVEAKEVIVVTGSLDEALTLADFVRQNNITVKRRNNYPGLSMVVSVLRIPDNNETAEVIQQLRTYDPKLWVDFNHRYQLLNSQQDAAINPKTWAFETLAWTDQHRHCGKGRKLGIIDTGVATTELLPQGNIVNQSFLGPAMKASAKHHGTAIASLLLGSSERSMPSLLEGSTLYSAGIFRQRGKKKVDTNAELIIKALAWMDKQGVTVINLSLGGPRNLPVEIAIRQILGKGTSVISAAGIDSQGEPLYPAAQEGVVAVTAIDIKRQPFAPNIRGDYIDFAAPGVDLWLLNGKGKGRYMSGSSFAAPIVAAQYLLLKEKAAKGELKKFAKDLGDKGKDKQFGWGLLVANGDC